MSAQMLEGWPVPSPNGYTAADLDLIPDLPPHTELIDGILVFVSPQKIFHSLAVDLLVERLRRIRDHPSLSDFGRVILPSC